MYYARSTYLLLRMTIVAFPLTPARLLQERTAEATTAFWPWEGNCKRRKILFCLLKIEKSSSADLLSPLFPPSLYVIVVTFVATASVVELRCGVSIFTSVAATTRKLCHS